MKRLLIVLIAIAVIVAGGWSVMWYMGRSKIVDRIEAEAAALKKTGWTVTWGAIEVGGFPFDHEVTVRSLAIVGERGTLVRVPRVVVARSKSAGNPVVAAMPEGVQVDLPLPEALRAQNATLPRIVKIRGTGQGLALTMTGLGSPLPTYWLRANAMKVEVDQKDWGAKIALQFNRMEAATGRHPKGRRLKFTADRVDTSVIDTSVAQRPKITTRYDKLTVSGILSASGVTEFLEGLRSRKPKLLEGAFQSSAHQIVAQQNTADGRGRFRLTWTGGAQTGLFGIDAGSLSYRGEDRLVTATLEMPGGAGASGPVFGLKAGAYQRAIVLPLWTGQAKPSPADLKIALVNLEAEPTLWMIWDPKNALDHGSGSVTVDLRSTLRFVSARGGPSVEFSNLSFKELRLRALGAEVSLTGDLEFLQPISQPIGDLDLRLIRGSALFDGLLAAGLLPRPVYDQATAILKVYAKPSKDGQAHSTTIAFGVSGVKVNGKDVPPKEPLEPTPPPGPAPKDDKPKPGGGKPAAGGDGGDPAPGGTASGDGKKEAAPAVLPKDPAPGGSVPAPAPPAPGAANDGKTTGSGNE